MNKGYLINHLNNFVGEGYGHIPRWALRIYGAEDWEAIQRVLAEWEKNGYLTVLSNPESSLDNEICLKMLNFIDADTPMVPNWISYEKVPPSYPGNWPDPEKADD